MPWTVLEKVPRWMIAISLIAFLVITVVEFYVLERQSDFLGMPFGPKSSTGLPESAVVAFNRNDGCPPQWQPFEKATSRFIVGAHEHNKNEKIDLRDGNGRELERYDRLSTSGYEKIALEEKHLPGHSHDLRNITVPDRYISAVETDTRGFRAEIKKVSPPPRGTSSVIESGQGGDPDYNYHFTVTSTVSSRNLSAHAINEEKKAELVSNIPPYVALFYCIKAP